MSRLIENFMNYKGGCYNPSVIFYKGKKLMFVRAEYDWEAYGGDKFKKLPELLLFSLNENSISYKGKISFSINDARIEDCRAIVINEKIFISGVIIRRENILPHIFIGELSGFEVNILKIFDSPNNRPEKNWAFFTKKDELYFVYSISPFAIFKVKENWDLELVSIENNEFKWFTNSFLSASTFPIYFNNEYYMFFHSKEFPYDYHQGLLKFSDDFKLIQQTSSPLFNIKDHVKNAKNKGVLYVSSFIINQNDEFEVYYGEGDQYSSKIILSFQTISKILSNEKVNSYSIKRKWKYWRNLIGFNNRVKK